MRLNVELEGLNQLLSQLDLAGEAAQEAARDVIVTLAEDTRKRAVQGIQRGPASGAVYRKYNPRRTHQASAPGQYPATDTGRLANNVRSELPTNISGMMTARVGTPIIYGKYLEFGTSRMAARPWLMRSFEQAKIDIERRLKAAFERKVKGR